ncbi:hypothetical protein, partial [Alicyclobacillus acidoterrestris]|uniref:hypothetical protein n=1 Tax=Alicyclobacillus acidoterrestris TaxID=1450 RepID=UPI0004CEBE83
VEIRVYLNDQFIGYKTLLKQVESPDDITSYLERNNVSGFTADAKDDHYKISVADDEVAHDIRHHLTAYLNTHTTGVTGDQPGF